MKRYVFRVMRCKAKTSSNFDLNVIEQSKKTRPRTNSFIIYNNIFFERKNNERTNKTLISKDSRPIAWAESMMRMDLGKNIIKIHSIIIFY